jgi:hypothetical protein
MSPTTSSPANDPVYNEPVPAFAKAHDETNDDTTNNSTTRLLKTRKTKEQLLLITRNTKERLTPLPTTIHKAQKTKERKRNRLDHTKGHR